MNELVNIKDVSLKFSSLIQHKLSHQLIYTVFHHVEVDENETSISEKYLKIKWSKLDDYPLPRLIDKYLEA